MEQAVMEWVCAGWDDMSCAVLREQELPLDEIKRLLKNTYLVLTDYHKDACVPKEVCKILLNMNDFVSYAVLMEDRDEVPAGFYHFEDIFLIIEAMKNGFFAGSYSYQYPKLEVRDHASHAYVVDLISGSLEQLDV